MLFCVILVGTISLDVSRTEGKRICAAYCEGTSSVFGYFTGSCVILSRRMAIIDHPLPLNKALDSWPGRASPIHLMLNFHLPSVEFGTSAGL